MTKKANTATTEKTTTKRSPRKRQGSSASQAEQRRLNRYFTLALLIGFVVVAAYFMLTGSDPLGLFTEQEPTPNVTTPAPALVGTGGGAGAGGAGEWWQVYFTDPQNINNPEDLTGSIPEKLIERIDQAQRTIHIAAFEFDLAPVADALIAAQKRGVKVQWVTDDEYGIEADEDAEVELFARLEKAKIKVEHDERAALMHNKFWIFDGQTVWTGSTNVTVNGNFRNNNNVIVIESPEVAAIYEREFAEMWNGEFGPTSPSTVDDQQVTIDGTPIQILFSPEDEVVSHLLPLINGAQKSLRFMAFSFTHDELGAAVLKRAEAGVDVKGIFETRSSETEYSELPTLYCAGLPVRQDGNPGTFHHKVFIIDDKILITGSLNFSDNADASNDENVIVVTNGDIAAQYLQEFERRWAEAVMPDPAAMNCK
jgi:phosphatidylserine/phosphatidylglycerophosphate/cardiolipin synthase-like enzyme